MTHKMTEEMKQVNLAVDKYYFMIFKLCLLLLCNEEDAKDATQETFIRYIAKHPAFYDEEHEKAWLITVSNHICKDILRKSNRRRAVSIEECTMCTYDANENELLSALMELPSKYKSTILLKFVYGYSIKEIAKILNISESAVKMRLLRGKDKLKKLYRKGGEAE